MIETRLFEVRDRATCMAVMATAVTPERDPDRGYEAWTQEDWLLRRSGWAFGQKGLYMRVLEPDIDSNQWAVGIVGHTVLHSSSGLNEMVRTIPVAFRHIMEHWHELTPGQVIDVRYILGEADAPAESDRRNA